MTARSRSLTFFALIGISTVVVIGGELVARAVLAVDDRFFDRRVDPKAAAPAFQTADYNVPQLFREFHEAGKRGLAYQPYIIWTRRPYHGSLINIDQHGERATWHNSPQPEALRVWVFGGSTTWGTGAPDSETIPSHLARIMNDEWGLATTVRNLGESAYVSTQETVRLLVELQHGQRPDVVVFYDGGNDADVATTWPDLPGAHVGMDRIKKKFEQDVDYYKLVRSVALYRVMRWVCARAGINLDHPVVQAEVHDDPHHTDAAAHTAASVWWNNYDAVDGLARSHGFVPVFVWQPYLPAGGKPLHPSEARLLQPEAEARTARMIQSVYTTVRARMATERHPGGRHMYDLADLFQQESRPLYMDTHHITGQGNALVAQRLAAILHAELCQSMPPHVSDHLRQQVGHTCAN